VELWIVPGAGHTGGLRTQPEEWERRVSSFLHRTLLKQMHGRLSDGRSRSKEELSLGRALGVQAIVAVERSLQRRIVATT
jgi:hypothetical protein